MWEDIGMGQACRSLEHLGPGTETGERRLVERADHARQPQVSSSSAAAAFNANYIARVTYGDCATTQGNPGAFFAILRAAANSSHAGFRLPPARERTAGGF